MIIMRNLQSVAIHFYLVMDDDPDPTMLLLLLIELVSIVEMSSRFLATFSNLSSSSIIFISRSRCCNLSSYSCDMSVILVTISFISFMKSRSILADPSLSLLFSVLYILRKKCSQSFFSSRLSSRRHWLKSSSFVFSCIRNLVLNSVI